jgi:hypothetical protein
MTLKLDSENSLRRKSQGLFLPVYAGFSFFWSVAANSIFQFMMYRNLQTRAGIAGPLEQEKVRFYVHKWIITAPPSVSIQSKWTLQMLSRGSTIFWGSILALVSFYIGWWIYTQRGSSLWKLWGPVFFAMTTSFVLFYFIYADQTGDWMAGWVYICLFVAIREISAFNPHIDVPDQGDARVKKLTAIQTLYFQYLVTSLAVIGAAIPTVFFTVYTTFRSRFADRPVLLNALEWPYYLAIISYSMVGIVGVLGGLTWEFHKKQNEIFRMRWDNETVSHQHAELHS